MGLFLAWPLAWLVAILVLAASPWTAAAQTGAADQARTVTTTPDRAWPVRRIAHFAASGDCRGRVPAMLPSIAVSFRQREPTPLTTVVSRWFRWRCGQWPVLLRIAA